MLLFGSETMIVRNEIRNFQVYQTKIKQGKIMP